jgi:uncharacterized protein YukE
MALPRSIQAQVEQANAVLAQANTPTQEPAAPQPTAELAPEAPEAQQQVLEPTASSEPQAQPTQPQSDVWEHKYKTLQGLFNREVPTLQHQVKDLRTQLETAVARLNEAADAKAKPSEPAAPVADPKDVENFGSDLVEMVQRIAERMFGRAVSEFQGQAARFEQRLAQLEQALQGTHETVAQTAEQSFFDRLTKMVPDWEQINANDAFLAWLAEVDPVYGHPRQAALNASQQSMNADRAAAVFKAFAATQPAAPKPNAVTKQVSPKAAATAAPTSQTKPMLTQQQVVDYYNAKRRGEYRGQEAEVQRIEAMINLAIAEGRVQ